MKTPHKKSALGFLLGAVVGLAFLATAVKSQMLSSSQLSGQLSKNQYNERQYFSGLSVWDSFNRTNSPLIVQDITGTNAFFITSNGVPAVVTAGNTYVGITTNVAMTNGTKLYITNGVVVGLF